MAAIEKDPNVVHNSARKARGVRKTGTGSTSVSKGVNIKNIAEQDASRLFQNDFYEKYPEPGSVLSIPTTVSVDLHYRNYITRIGPRWTFFPSHLDCFVDDQTGFAPAFAGNRDAIQRGFPPRNWPYATLKSRFYGMQANDEIACSMVNPNMLVKLGNDIANRIRGKIPLHVDVHSAVKSYLLSYLNAILSWAAAFLFADAKISWQVVQKSLVTTDFDFPPDSTLNKEEDGSTSRSVVVPKFPRSPEYATIVRIDRIEDRIVMNNLASLAAVGKLYNANRNVTVQVGKRAFYAPAADLFEKKPAFKTIGVMLAAHVVDTLSPSFHAARSFISTELFLHNRNVQNFDPSMRTGDIRSNVTGILFRVKYGDEATTEFFKSMPAVNMFNYRAWIKDLVKKFGQQSATFTASAKNIMTIVFLAVARGGLEVTFHDEGYRVGGHALCALQQYRVGSRVLFLRADDATRESYDHHGNRAGDARREVCDLEPDVLVNAYDITDLAQDPIGHGIDVNMFSGKSGDDFVAHESSVLLHVQAPSGEYSTNGEWCSRWHAWKSIGRHKGVAGLVLSFDVVLEEWEASTAVTDERIPSPWGSQVHEDNNNFTRKTQRRARGSNSGVGCQWILVLTDPNDPADKPAIEKRPTASTATRSKAGEPDCKYIPSVLSYSCTTIDPHSKKTVKLEWQYFFTKTPAGAGKFFFEVFITDVCVVAEYDYWQSVWRHSAGVSRGLVQQDPANVSSIEEGIVNVVQSKHTFYTDTDTRVEDNTSYGNLDGASLHFSPGITPIKPRVHTTAHSIFCPVDLPTRDYYNTAMTPTEKQKYRDELIAHADKVKTYLAQLDKWGSGTEKLPGPRPASETFPVISDGKLVPKNLFGTSNKNKGKDKGKGNGNASRPSSSSSGSQFGLAHCVEYLLPVETRAYTLEDFK